MMTSSPAGSAPRHSKVRCVFSACSGVSDLPTLRVTVSEQESGARRLPIDDGVMDVSMQTHSAESQDAPIIYLGSKPTQSSAPCFLLFSLFRAPEVICLRRGSESHKYCNIHLSWLFCRLHHLLRGVINTALNSRAQGLFH